MYIWRSQGEGTAAGMRKSFREVQSDGIHRNTRTLKLEMIRGMC